MKWLHISDIHFMTGDYRVEDIRKSLLNTIKGFGRLDFILFTGDLLFQHQPDQGGVRLLQQICAITKVPSKNLFMCPGNHDIDRSCAGRAELIQTIRNNNKLMTDEEYHKTCRLGYDEYANYYRELTEREYSNNGVRFDKNGSLPIRIVELNSNLTSTDDNDCGNISIMTPGLARISDELEDDTKINIVIMHHGIDQIRDEEKVLFQHWIDNHYIDIVCCGHTHHASIHTYDETSHGTRQLTAGTVQNIDYNPPSFFVYNYMPDSCDVDVEVYTFNKRVDSWRLDTGLSRAFPNGKRRLHLWRLFQRQYIEEAKKPISSQDVIERYGYWINHLNMRFSDTVGETIKSVRTGNDEPFTAGKIMQSLVKIGLPVDTAIDVVNRSVEDLIVHKRRQAKMSTSEICEYVYRSMLFTLAANSNYSSETKQWAAKFARHYWQNEVQFTLLENGKRKPYNDTYLKQSLLPQLLTNLKDDGLVFETLPAFERNNMIKEVHDYIDGLDAVEFNQEVLLSTLREMIRVPPHPWLYDKEKRLDGIKYNLDHLEIHTNKVRDRHMEYIVYQEVFYHAGAILMLSGGCFIGSIEEAPLRFFRDGIHDMIRQESGREIQHSPYFSSVARRSKSVMDNIGVAWDSLIHTVNYVYDIKAVTQNPISLNEHSCVTDIANLAMQIGKKILGNPDVLN